jgi:hypothetical protein
MAKMMVECSNPNDLKELEAAMEQAAGKCNITHYKQHLGLVEAGKSTSQRDSARIIAAEVGESPAAVEQRIRRGKQKVRQPVADEQVEVATAPTDPEKEYSEAMARAVSVITSLKCIRSTLPGQKEALQVVLEWIEKRLKLKPRSIQTADREGLRVTCSHCGNVDVIPWATVEEALRRRGIKNKIKAA